MKHIILLRRSIFAVLVLLFVALICAYFESGEWKYPSAKITKATRGELPSHYAHELGTIMGYYRNSNAFDQSSPSSLRPEEARSPDGQYMMELKSFGDSFHLVAVRHQGTLRDILYLQECDPGSGRSHHCCWSADSEAILIYGSGKPMGHELNQKLSLIYLLKSDLLYSVNMSDFGWSESPKPPHD